MKTIHRLLLGLVIAFGLSAGAQAKGESNIIRVGGSTTLLPVIAQCAKDFMEGHGTWDKADPSLPAEKIVIYVSGGGSGTGVKSVLDKSLDIGLVSRFVKDKEKKLLGDYKTYLVGKDAVVIAARNDNLLVQAASGLTSAKLAKILSGEMATYKAAGAAADKPIVLVVRDAGADSAELVQEKVMGDKNISPWALWLPSQGALLKKLESNPLAIGYISSGIVLGSDKLKAFKLDGIDPTNENVINGTYPIARPLMMVVQGKATKHQQRFIDYVLGDKGQAIVTANHYVPAMVK